MCCLSCSNYESCLSDIGALQSDWDGDDAELISKADIELTRQALDLIVDATPSCRQQLKVFPAQEGGIDLEWPHFDLKISDEYMFVQFGEHTV